MTKLKPKTLGRLIHDNLQGIYNLALLSEEPFFSTRPCDCCKSELGSSRYRAVGTIGKKHTADRKDLLCCEDCALWLFS